MAIQRYDNDTRDGYMYPSEKGRYIKYDDVSEELNRLEEIENWVIENHQDNPQVSKLLGFS